MMGRVQDACCIPACPLIAPFVVDPFLSDALNPSQSEAVRYLDGPLLVLAGAGSGKTRVITRKIAWLIDGCGYAPQHIAAITFTNKAAQEMRSRTAQLLPGRPLGGLTLSTFHSLGLQMLRRDAAAFGYKPGFSVLDATDAQQVLAGVMQQNDRLILRRVQGRISQWKNALTDPQAALSAATDDIEALDARAYQAYLETLRAYQAVDFDDLIRLPVEVFGRQPELLERWRAAFRYVLIDEYQDTNACQYALVQQLCGLSGALTAVGDDDQAIYGWRGADANNLRRLHEDFPRLKVVQLTQNYRSSLRILQAANSVIANNDRLYDKQLWSEHGPGDPLQVIAARDDAEEAKLVVMRMQAHKFAHRTRFSDYAVLYRSNHQARVVEQVLREEKVPYQISGGQSFFDRAEIKDVLAYMRLLANPDDDPAFIRAATVPRRGIGPATLETLGEYAATRQLSLFAAAFEAGLATRLAEAQREPLLTFCHYIQRTEARVLRTPAGELLQEILRDIGYEAWLFDQEEGRAAQNRWNQVQEFAGWIARKGEADERNLHQLTQTIALMNLLEGRSEEEPDAVRLSTVHAAKGLEFGHVFLIGVEEEILPHREAVEAGHLEEERRLMYVAITRAQRSLTLSHCLRRKRAGDWTSCEPSRFLAEIDAQTVQRAESAPTDDKTRREQGNAQLARIRAMLGKS